MIKGGKYMSKIQRFEDLEARKIARELTKDIYRISKNDLFIRDHGLRDQICRAAVSVMSNIAEGFERDGNKEFINFLSIAKGSAGEVRSQLYVALDQEYISESEFNLIYNKANENSRVISGLIKYLKQSELRGRKFNQNFST
jgi:four helix bundle protein